MRTISFLPSAKPPRPKPKSSTTFSRPSARVQELNITKEKLENWASLAFCLKNISGEYDPTGVVKHMDVFYIDPLTGLIPAKDKDEWIDGFIGKWRDFVGDFRFVYIGGGHRNLIKPPYVKGFARHFMEGLIRRESEGRKAVRDLD